MGPASVIFCGGGAVGKPHVHLAAILDHKLDLAAESVVPTDVHVGLTEDTLIRELDRLVSCVGGRVVRAASRPIVV